MPRRKEFDGRVPIHFDNSQMSFLRQESILQGVSVAEIVRTAVNQYRAALAAKVLTHGEVS